MTTLLRFRIVCCVFLVCTLAALVQAQTFSTLLNFDFTNGSTPQYENLTLGVDGNYYGTTEFGGTTGQGTVFKITPQGTLTTVYNFAH